MKLFFHRAPKVVYQVLIFVKRDRSHRWVILINSSDLSFTNPSAVRISNPSLKRILILILALSHLGLIECVSSLIGLLGTILCWYFTVKCIFMGNLLDWVYQILMDVPCCGLQMFSWLLSVFYYSLKVLAVSYFYIYIHVSDCCLVNNLVRSRTNISLSPLSLRYELITLIALVSIPSRWIVLSVSIVLLHPRRHERFRCWPVLCPLSYLAL